MTIDVPSFAKALEPTRQGLDAAGFDLDLAEADGKLRMLVRAREGACEDCLVPKSLFRRMAVDEIQEAGLQQPEIEILYPLDLRRA
jgi:hypothetical protein